MTAAHETTYRLYFPRDLRDEQVLDALLALNGASTLRVAPLRLSVRGQHGRIEHRLSTFPSQTSGVVSQLPHLIPGLLLERATAPVRTPAVTHLWHLWQSTSRRPLRVDHPELTSRALLTALLSTRGTELLELRWLLGPVRRPLSVGSRHVGVMSESWALALATAAVRPPGDLDAEARSALRTKRAEPAWRLLGQLAVAAADDRRARQLAGNLLAALRTAEGPGVRLGVQLSP